MPVAEGSTALERVDAIASTLVDRARPTTFRAATTPAEVATAQRLRGRAVLDHDWGRTEDLIDGREVDTDDDRAVHVLAFLDDRAIGTCRIIYPQAGRRLPMEMTAGASPLPADAVEVGRVVVFHPVGSRHGSVTAGLIAFCWLEIRRHGHRRIGGSVSAGILRLYRRIGFLVEVVGPPVRTLGEVRYPIVFAPSDEAAALADARIPDPGRAG